MSDVRLGVCGLGLIGSSLVRATGPQNAVVMDPSPSASDAMRALGATVVDSLSGFTSCDVIALAAPTAVNSALLAELMDVGPRVPTFDLGSVKEPILEVWRSDPSFPFVGTHPMAGSERSGAAAGDADLFRGSAWPVVVAPDTDAAALSAVVDVILSTGARVVPVTAPAHDTAVAVVSHLSHLLAGALGAAVDGAPDRALAIRLAAGSFRDGSRVAASPPERTAEFLASNGGRVAVAAREAAQSLLAAADAADRSDQEALVAFLRPGHDARVAFEDASPDPVQDIAAADLVGVLEVLRSLTDTGSAIVGRTGDTVTVTVVQEGPP